MRWQYDKTQAGSGALGNLGSHVIHLIQWWFGDIQRVCAMLTTAVKERNLPDGSGRVPVHVDDTCAFLAELVDGTPVIFDISSVTWAPRTSMEIVVFGSEGGLIFQDDWGAEDAPTGRNSATRKGDHMPSLVRIPSRLTGEFLDMPDYYTPLRGCYTRMAAEFVSAIHEDRPAAPNFHDGLRVQEVIDAVLQSAASKSWVPLSHTDPLG
jgi:predicted dehydrogenase